MLPRCYKGGRKGGREGGRKEREGINEREGEADIILWHGQCGHMPTATAHTHTCGKGNESMINRDTLGWF